MIGQLLHDHSCLLVMNSNVRASKSSCPKQDPDFLTVWTEPAGRRLLPNRGELSRRLPRSEFRGLERHFVPVLVGRENRWYGPLQSPRRDFAVRMNRLTWRFTDRSCIIGKYRQHHTTYKKTLHFSAPFNTSQTLIDVSYWVEALTMRRKVSSKAEL